MLNALAGLGGDGGGGGLAAHAGDPNAMAYAFPPTSVPVVQAVAVGPVIPVIERSIDLTGLEGRWTAQRSDFSGFGHCCCQRWVSIERNIWKDQSSGLLQGKETVHVTLCGCCTGKNYAVLQHKGNTLRWNANRLTRTEHYTSDTLANVETRTGNGGLSVGTVTVSRQHEMHYEESSPNGLPVQPGLLAAHTTLTLRHQGPAKIPPFIAGPTGMQMSRGL